MKAKRIVALGLVVMLLLASLTACGSGAATPAASSAENTAATPAASSAENTATPTTSATMAPSEDQFKDPMEISIATWDIETGLADAGNDALFQTLIKKFNITIKPINVTWDDYIEKVNVWASSGQLPDLFSADKATSTTYKTWAEQGVVHVIPDDLSKFQNLSKFLSVPDVQALKIDGKLYCIPRGTYDSPGDWCMDQTMLYRWDWAQQLGINKEPETWAEFEAMLAMFVSSDPEGKGKPVGITLKPGYLGVLQRVWDPVGSWVKEDGKWIPSFLSKGRLPTIKEVKKWYDKGLVDKDFTLAKGTEAEDKFLSGRSGAFLGGATPSDLYLFEKEKWAKNYPDKDMYTSCKVWKVPASPDGKRYSHTALTFWSEAYINAKASDDKVNRILSLADYMLSPEGFMYSSGIKGVDYTVDAAGKAIPTDPSVDIAKKYPSSSADGGIPKLFNWVQNLNVAFSLPEYNPKMVAFAKANYDWYKANTSMIPIDFVIQNIKTPGMEKYVNTEGDDFVRLIMSKGDIDTEYKDIIKSYMEKGLDVVITEVNAEAVKLGK